jgi:hypothetical protein
VTTGPHRLTSTAADPDGFTILTYGLGYVVSYGYTAGQLFVPKQGLVTNPQPKPNKYGNALVSPNDNRIEVRNLTLEDLYLDEAVFTPKNPEDAYYNVRFREALDPESGRLGGGATAAYHLTTNAQPERPIEGTLTIYNHTFRWHDIAPAKMDVTYYPVVASAGVADAVASSPLHAEMYPNPMTGLESGATLRFSMPETADLTITIFDELGRTVRLLREATYTQGAHELRITRIQAGAALPTGTYRIAMHSRKLGVADNAMLVVQ